MENLRAEHDVDAAISQREFDSVAAERMGDAMSRGPKKCKRAIEADGSEVDAATPLLMAACANRQILPAVQFALHPPGATADVVNVTLHDAVCSEIEDTTADDDIHELETISFTFQKITVENVVAKTSFEDDWTDTAH